MKVASDELRKRKLKAALAAKGMTQYDLAKKLRIEQSCVSRRMNHVSRMTIGDLETLCNVLDISIMDVLGVEA